jgi:hypothetical protein
MGLPDFKRDPSPILPILENLKADPSEYVRRSVANNLNDIAKDHPDLALRIAEAWSGKNPATDWIVKHGCRTLLKRGNEAVLHLHGFNPLAKASVDQLMATKEVLIGGHLAFSFVFVNKEKRRSRFRLEYSIDYQTLSGKISRKVFKLTENSFEPFQTFEFKRRQSFKQLTTRKHFKGKHRLRILSNGKEKASMEFFVC